MKIYFAFLFALAAWLYRLWRINGIIQHGVLLDFLGYYNAGHTVITSQPNIKFLATTVFGPFVLIPYLPFAFFPFKLAEYLITILNIFCYYLVFSLLWKRFV